MNDDDDDDDDDVDDGNDDVNARSSYIKTFGSEFPLAHLPSMQWGFP